MLTIVIKRNIPLRTTAVSLAVNGQKLSPLGGDELFAKKIQETVLPDTIAMLNGSVIEVYTLQNAEDMVE